ncbi:hypothetical protein SNEBB_008412 [Seison nebaliae]|nr:hypothetical protein SNEBB_008412 [Seison nebaliae]
MMIKRNADGEYYYVNGQKSGNSLDELDIIDLENEDEKIVETKEENKSKRDLIEIIRSSLQPKEVPPSKLTDSDEEEYLEVDRENCEIFRNYKKFSDELKYDKLVNCITDRKNKKMENEKIDDMNKISMLKIIKPKLLKENFQNNSKESQENLNELESFDSVDLNPLKKKWDDWNPMTDHYYFNNKLNDGHLKYEVRDDGHLTFLNYHQKTEICQDFLKKDKCERGKNCQYVHSKLYLSETDQQLSLVNEEFAPSEDLMGFPEKSMKFDILEESSCLLEGVEKVHSISFIISHIQSSIHFQISLIRSSSNKLNISFFQFIQNLTNIFKKKIGKKSIKNKLMNCIYFGIGECLVYSNYFINNEFNEDTKKFLNYFNQFFSEKTNVYRVKFLKYSSDPTTAEVKFIDFGINCVVALENLYSTTSYYYLYPIISFRCALRTITTIEPIDEWKKVHLRNERKCSRMTKLLFLEFIKQQITTQFLSKEKIEKKLQNNSNCFLKVEEEVLEETEIVINFNLCLSWKDYQLFIKESINIENKI